MYKYIYTSFIFPTTILDTSSPQFVYPLLFLDCLPLLSHKTSWEKCSEMSLVIIHKHTHQVAGRMNMDHKRPTDLKY